MRYTNSSLVANKQADIAVYTVPAQSSTDGSVPKIKPKIHMTANGIFVLESAARLTEVEDDAPAPAPAEGEAPKEGDESDMKVDEPPVKKTKTIKTPIVIQPRTSSAPAALMTQYIEAENENQVNDKLIIATEHAKNRVE